MEPQNTQKGQVQKEEVCVHPYILQWSGKCEGCRKAPLSPSLPDPHNSLEDSQSCQNAA
jgi:hypothetical protein